MVTLSDRKLRRNFNVSRLSDRSVRRSLFATLSEPDGGIVKGAFASGIMDHTDFVVDPTPEDDQVQGASLDLRVGDEVFTMQGDFTSLRPEEVSRYALRRDDISDGKDFVLLPGHVYVVRSLEKIRIPSNYQGVSDAKSSLARIGCGAGAATIRNGIIGGEIYNGEPENIYFKIEPHAFPVIIRKKESRPLQIRFREIGSGPLNVEEIKREYGKLFRLSEGDVDLGFKSDEGALVEENGLILRLDTSEYYVQRNVRTPIDISKVGYYNSGEFFDFVQNEDGVLLDPNRLYLFGSRETVHLGRLVCGDLVRSPDTLGQGLSNNFARFFDPGFEGEITLEVWSYKPKPWILRGGQYFGRVLLERLDDAPLHPYQGTYVGQKAPRLPKFFKLE